MIKAIRLNAINIMVRDLDVSLKWYKKHFGFEHAYDVEGGVLISKDGVELVLSPMDNAEAPLADPKFQRCIHTIAFEVSKEDLEKVTAEFSEDKGIVEIHHSKFDSYITEDPDGYCVELFTERTA